MIVCVRRSLGNNTRSIETYQRQKYVGVKSNIAMVMVKVRISSPWRQKDLTGYCFNYIDKPFCLRTDDLNIENAQNPVQNILTRPIPQECLQ